TDERHSARASRPRRPAGVLHPRRPGRGDLAGRQGPRVRRLVQPRSVEPQRLRADRAVHELLAPVLLRSGGQGARAFPRRLRTRPAVARPRREPGRQEGPRSRSGPSEDKGGLMQPFYFGTSEQQLFGVYHAAESGSSKRAGVVLCQPVGHEYLRAHRAFRNLAMALAGQGFHVLRFDYFATGDSAGDGEQLSVRQCLSDLATAIDELKDIAGVTKVSLVGLRLGATFAALAASGRS